MMKKERKTAIALSVLMMFGQAGVQSTYALDAEAVLNDNVTELQQSIIDYIFVKNYIAGKITLGEEFMQKLDINKDGKVNIIDSNYLKYSIFEMLRTNEAETPVTTEASSAPAETKISEESVSASSAASETAQVTAVPVASETAQVTSAPAASETAVVSSVTPETTVTTAATSAATQAVTTAVTTPVPVTSAVTSARIVKGDYVSYKGDAHYTASGNGKSVAVSGIFKVTDVLVNSVYPYTIQLENAGWVAEKDVKKVTTAAPVTTPVPPVTTTTAAVTAKVAKGDMVSYTGDAHYTASGNGNTVKVSGIFKVTDVLVNSIYPYTVQLENTGWVAEKDVVKVTSAPVTTPAPPVTTTAAVTTVPVTTAPAVSSSSAALKKGDMVSYTGDAHYTASGNGNTVKVSGIFKVAEILVNSVYPYTVQLENTGWVSYKDLTGKDQPVVPTVASLLDGNTFRIKNSASGKYLTVTGTADRSNVCQSALKSDSTQLFKASRYYNSDTFRLYSCTADKSKVLDVVKNGTSVADGCNVQLYDAVDPDAQCWKIEDAGDGKYRILAAKDKTVALTSLGSSDGTSLGSYPSSMGNVFLKKYTGSSSQLWIFEKQ